MKNLSLSTLLLLVGLSVASAAVTSLLLTPPAASEQPKPAAPTQDLASAVDELLEQVAILSERMEGFELSPAPQRAVAQSASAQGFEEEVRAFMAEQKQEQGGKAKLPLAFQAEVESALTSIREQEEYEAEQVKLQQRDAWITDTVAKLAPELGLSPTQTDQMGEAWAAKADMDSELGRLWEEGLLTSEAAGDTKQHNEEVHQQNLQGFLSPEQYENYTNTINQWRGGGGRGKQ